MITNLCKKSTQALNYFARKKDGKINKMKAIKLIYFADRYHLRKYGRTIVGDTYLAMKLGPVGSNLLDTANLSEKSLSSECLKYVKRFLAKKEDELLDLFSKKEVNFDVFSQTDIEVLETIYEEFSDKDQFELADMTHYYPEWLKHKKDLDKGKKSIPMDYLDFFLNPKVLKSHIFNNSKEELEIVKNIYQEDLETILSLS